MKKQQSEHLTKELQDHPVKSDPNSYLELVAAKLSLILLVLALAGMFSACENDINTINSLSMVDSLPLEYFRDIEVTYSDSGKVKAYLESPLMVRIEDDEPYMEFPEGFKAIFYDSVLNPESEITANYGISYENTKIMEARNNVIVKNMEKGERLDTEHLIWDRKKGIFYSDVFVKITRADEVLYGDGLTSDQSFDRYTIKNPTGEFELNPDEQ
jgi:LPS export ABC transporter protein LptC